MRIPSFPTLVRTFYAVSNATSSFSATARYKALSPFSRSVAYKSMPTIPFLGSLFSSKSSSSNMEYPLKKTDDEWQAVLNKGERPLTHNSNATAYLPLGAITDSLTRAIPHPPRKRHRAPRQREIRQTLPKRRRLCLRRMRHATLQSHTQIQFRLRMARVLRLAIRRGNATHGQHFRDGQNGNRV